MESGGNRWLQLLNNTGRGQSRDLLFWISFFVYLTLLSIIPRACLKRRFWKVCIRTIYDLDPGLNLLER